LNKEYIRLPAIISPSPHSPLGAQSRFPHWLRKPIQPALRQSRVEGILAAENLKTVCKEAGCPNRNECFASGTATFLIMGNTCTRNCGFCGVGKGTPAPLDAGEPARVAAAVRRMSLSYVVITSVTRDDLPDGGAAHFAKTVRHVRETAPGAKIEVLVPDFQGNEAAIRTVIDSGVSVFNHNIETIPRLYDTVRPQANYQQSLQVLEYASRTAREVKSGLMVGLGETPDEVISTLGHLGKAGCRSITIGQYLQPDKTRLPVAEFIKPEQFDTYAREGKALGIEKVFSAPFVRSSYHASELFERPAHK
jgi:lipoyl synthase